MTAPMANPSVRAQKRRDTKPKADFITSKDRSLGDDTRGIAVARSAAKNTSSAAAASEIDPNKPLTVKQRQFAEAWAKGESIPNASLRAGYADDHLGYRLARMPNILALKHQYELKYEADAQMDRKQVMEGFKEAIEMAKLMADPTAMISGWREIGKMCGYYAPVETKVKIDITGNVTMTRLTQMSDAELLELIEKGKPAVDTPLLTDENDENDDSQPA